MQSVPKRTAEARRGVGSLGRIDTKLGFKRIAHRCLDLFSVKMGGCSKGGCMKFPSRWLALGLPVALVCSAMAQSAKEKGEAFLRENAKKEGVKQLPSGLQVKIINPGNETKPKSSDQVEVHYRGTTIDGKEFDSSYKRKETITFGLKQVIRGWTEGMQLIGEGGKAELYIPANLAYGMRGAPPVIGPDETLIFEVELIKVKK